MSVASDDDALCRYSENAGGQPYSQCRGKFERMRVRVSAESAARIDGYALLRAQDPQPEVAGRCKDGSAGQDCNAGDVTGSVRKP